MPSISLSPLGERVGVRGSYGGPSGFTILQVVVVITLLGFLMAPLLRVIGPAGKAERIQNTTKALATARDALVAFAAANNGCLPFAADYEGGVRDTQADGTTSSSYYDTGEGRIETGPVAYHSGDLPWGDLGLGPDFLDGENWRLQYYVASNHTDWDNQITSAYTCTSGYRGWEIAYNEQYRGASTDLYVYADSPTNGRVLVKISDDKTIADPVDLDDKILNDPDVTNVSSAYPASLLELRKGPDVNDGGSGETLVSAQNVFILIATGDNRNATLDRGHVRDANHEQLGGTSWALNTANVDDMLFSQSPGSGATDPSDDGDDTLLVMSFNDFKSAMSGYGINLEAVCDSEMATC